MSNKPKKCVVCKREFLPRSTTAKICSVDCAIEHSKIIAAKKQSKITQIEHKTHLEAIKKARPLSWYRKKAQEAFNRFIRLRDGNKCISCGTENPNIQYAAGHFRTRGAASQLAFNEDNVNVQCNYRCNLQLSGNIGAYETALRLKIGNERVDALKSNSESVKYTVSDLEAIRKKYTALCKAKKNP